MDIHRLYRTLYIGFFVVLGLCIVGLLIITPGDAIYQARNNDQLYNIFVIAGAYALTAVIGGIIAISRRWTSKAVLKSIPKTWIPIEKDDVSKKVRKMIVASLTRSAVISYGSRPRIESSPATVLSEQNTRDAVTRLTSADGNRKKEHAVLHKRHGETENGEERAEEKGEGTVDAPPEEPMWGTIAHVGWSSPVSPDLPNLQYITVILELPHLIEARAVSVAPPDPDSVSNPPMPDFRAVDLLQRPPSMGLRDYISHLNSINIISDQKTASSFLAAYEYARFSSQPLTENQFRDLMKRFAELLRSMRSLSPAILSSLDIDQVESDIDDDNSASTSPATPRSRSLVSSHSVSSHSGNEGTIRTAPSRRLGTSVASTTRRFPEFSTAPATPSKRRVISRTPSANSFAQSRRPYNGNSSPSSTSLSSSQGSVIRLSSTNEEGALPYTLTIPGVR